MNNLSKDKRKRLRRQANLSICEMLTRGLDPDSVLRHCVGCQSAGQTGCEIHGGQAANGGADVELPIGSEHREASAMVAPADPDRPKWSRLHGMHGYLWVDSFTGEPREPRERLPEWYSQIDRVDWPEYLAWRETLPTNIVPELDLHDFGMRYVDGSYEPADEGSREATLDSMLEMEEEEAEAG